MVVFMKDKLMEIFKIDLMLIMALLWLSGFLFAVMIFAFDTGDKVAVALSAIFSFAGFAAGFIAYKSEEKDEEKKRRKSKIKLRP